MESTCANCRTEVCKSEVSAGVARTEGPYNPPSTAEQTNTPRINSTPRRSDFFIASSSPVGARSVISHCVQRNLTHTIPDQFCFESGRHAASLEFSARPGGPQTFRDSDGRPNLQGKHRR